MLYIGVILIFSNKYHEYSAALEIRKLENELRESSNTPIELEIDQIDDLPKEEENNNESVDNQENNNATSNDYNNVSYSTETVDFNKLNEINSDTVAWVRVTNTSINYPVMQSSDNHFYLFHDIYKNYMVTGSIFMDYRSKLDSKNIILYGHAALSGIMFGTLHNVIYPYWYTNPDNVVILTTKNDERVYKVFSVYRVEETNDYLTTNFNTNESFTKYIDMIKQRSVYNFNIDVNNSNEIITLSTCSSNNRRLVVHAVRIK